MGRGEKLRRWWAEATPEQRQKRLDNMAAARREIIERERSRMVWGMAPRTRIHLVRDQEKATKLCGYRRRLRKLGYIVERRSNTAYYTEDTRRGSLIERRAIKNGMTIKPMEYETGQDIPQMDTVEEMGETEETPVE